MDIIGSYRLCPHKQPVIQGTRPIISSPLLGQVLSQKPLDNVPQTIGNIFTLCGVAQTLTSQLAIQSAKTEQASHLSEQQRQTLRWETLGMHVRQLAIKIRGETNWQLGLSAIQQQNTDSLNQWIGKALLAHDTKQWWDKWQTNGIAWLNEWLSNNNRHQPTELMNYYRQLDFLQALALGGQCLALDTSNVMNLWQSWKTDSDFCQYPHLNGQVFETGAWSRGNASYPLQQNGWTRQMSPLIDMLALLFDNNAQYLQTEVVVTDSHSAIAYVEMTRGVLVHFVSLDTDRQHIKRYGVLAPTEWNFHPLGRLAQSIATDSLSDKQLSALANAFDACVTVSIDTDNGNNSDDEETQCTK